MKDANYGSKDEGNDDEVSHQSVISQSSVSHQSVSSVCNIDCYLMMLFSVPLQWH